jgi:DNA-binding winged helix-turn-helix (wHTH) protein
MVVLTREALPAPVREWLGAREAVVLVPAGGPGYGGGASAALPLAASSAYSAGYAAGSLAGYGAAGCGPVPLTGAVPFPIATFAPALAPSPAAAAAAPAPALSPAPAAAHAPAVIAPIRFQRLEVDLAERRARWNGRELGVSERELELLALLASRAGRACTFKELFTRVWGERYRVDPPVVHTAMRRLRRKLEAEGAGVVLESVRGYGFRMAAESADTAAA